MPHYCSTDRFTSEYTGRKRTRWLALVPPSHTIEDVQTPEYFGQVKAVQDIRPFDLIEIQAEDFSWYGELIVEAVPKTIPCVFTTKRFIEIKQRKELPDGWSIVYRGLADKHVILRLGHEVEKGFVTETEATIQAIYLATPKASVADKAVAKAAEKVAEPVAAEAPPERKKPGPKPKTPASDDAPPAA